MTPTSKVCPTCESLFIVGSQSTQIYCSLRCQKRASYLRKKERYLRKKERKALEILDTVSLDWGD